MNREHAPGYDGIDTGTADAPIGDTQRRALGSLGLRAVVARAVEGRSLPLDPQRLAFGSAGQARALLESGVTR